MLDIYLLKREGLPQGTIDHINQKEKVWADAINPTKNELKQIAEITDISVEDLIECIDPGERPRLFEYEKFSLIVFRVPHTYKNKTYTTPVSIFISKVKNSVLTIRLKELDAFERVKAKILKNNLPIEQEGLTYLIYRIIDENFNDYFMLLDKLSEKIEKIETKVIKTHSKNTIVDIMDIKKTLIYFNKDLVGNREVIAGIEKEYVMHIEKKQVKKFRNIYNDSIQLIDMVSTERDILTGALDIYVSAVSNSLNKIMKTLTILSAFVMVPTLISGIYGMNFSNSPFNMPELSWKYGYFFALGLMLISTISMFLWFKKKKWL